MQRYKFVLAGPLTHICNLALTKSQYPSMWKVGITSPIPKGTADLQNPKNWRPVQLNCVPSKVLETIMNRQMRSYLEGHGLITPTQHGKISSLIKCVPVM